MNSGHKAIAISAVWMFGAAISACLTYGAKAMQTDGPLFGILLVMIIIGIATK